MKKMVITALLMGTIMAAGAGCKGNTDTDKQSVQESNAAEEETAQADGNSEDILLEGEEDVIVDETEAIQTEADLIDEQHQAELATESVEQTAFAQRRLYLAESDNWIRVSSQNREDGSFGEEYQANGDLTFSWNYAPAEKADAQAGLDVYMTSEAWTLSESTYSEDITAALGCETYYYTAYEDDNGYSMLHRGIYINTETGYYTADFSMMEGDSGEYYEMAGQYLAQVSFAD